MRSSMGGCLSPFVRGASEISPECKVSVVRPHRLLAGPTVTLLVACGGSPSNPPAPPPLPPATTARPDEPHFADLRQLTFGGENAEAYWSWAGDQLILQARGPGQSCDRIVRTNPF